MCEDYELSEKRSRKAKISKEQQIFYIQFCEENSNFLNEKFTESYTLDKFKNDWNLLAMNLNSNGIKCGSVTEWKSNISNWKSQVRGKFKKLEAFNQLNESKSEPMKKPIEIRNLNEVEIRLLALIGTPTVNGKRVTNLENLLARQQNEEAAADSSQSNSEPVKPVKKLFVTQKKKPQFRFEPYSGIKNLQLIRENNNLLRKSNEVNEKLLKSTKRLNTSINKLAKSLETFTETVSMWNNSYDISQLKPEPL